MEIAEGIKQAGKRDAAKLEQLSEIEDNFLPEGHSESERMLLRAWLLGHDFVDIVYNQHGQVDDHVTFDEGHGPVEHGVRGYARFDRYDLRGCESPKDVFALIDV